MSGIDKHPIHIISEADRQAQDARGEFTFTMGGYDAGPGDLLDPLNPPPVITGYTSQKTITFSDDMGSFSLPLYSGIFAEEESPGEFVPYLYIWSRNGAISCGTGAETWHEPRLELRPTENDWIILKSRSPVRTATHPDKFGNPWRYWWAIQPITVKFELSYPMRKMATIHSHDRYGLDDEANVYNWGSYFLSNNLERTIDTSPYYRDCRTDWIYWPWDGPAMAKVTVNGQSRSVSLDAGFDAQHVFNQPKIIANRVAVSMQTAQGFDTAEAITGLRHFGQSPQFENETGILLDGANPQRKIADVSISGDQIRVTTIPYQSGYVWPGDTSIALAFTVADHVSIQADTLNAVGQALQTPLTVTSYEAPGQPPSGTDGWYSMPTLAGISFAAPGGYSEIVRQYYCEMIGPANTLTFEPTAGQRTTAIGLAYSLASLATAELEVSAWRFPLCIPMTEARWTWLVYNIIDENIVIDPCTSTADWSTSGGASISISSGLLVQGPSGKAIAKTYDMPNASFDACRYMRLTFDTGAARPCTVNVNGKRWDVEANGAVVIDLCMPHNMTGNDTQETRLTGDTGWSFGVKSPATVALTFDFAGDVKLLSVGLDGETCKDEQLVYQQEVIGDLPGYGEERRGLWMQVDGKLVFDEVIGKVEAQVIDPGPPEIVTRNLPTPYPIQAVVDALYVRIGAFTAVGPITVFDNDRSESVMKRPNQHSQYLTWDADGQPIPTATNDYYTGAQYWHNGREAFNLLPMQRRQNGADAYSLEAWAWADRIEFGPGTCRALTHRKMFGGTIQGLLSGDDFKPIIGGAVEISKDAMSYIVQADQTGFYSSRHLDKPGDWRSELASNALIYEEYDPIHHGRRARASFAGKAMASEAGSDLLVHPLTGEVFLASATAEGLLLVRSSMDGGRSWSAPNSVDGASGASQPCLFSVPDFLGSIGLAWVEPGNIRLAFSSDGFDSRSSIKDIVSGGSHVRAKVNQLTGVTIVAWWSNGNIVAAPSYDGGRTLEPPVSVATAPEAPFGLDTVPDNLGSWAIVYLDSGGTPVTNYSSDDGATWITP